VAEEIWQFILDLMRKVWSKPHLYSVIYYGDIADLQCPGGKLHYIHYKEFIAENNRSLYISIIRFFILSFFPKHINSCQLLHGDRHNSAPRRNNFFISSSVIHSAHEKQNIRQHMFKKRVHLQYNKSATRPITSLCLTLWGTILLYIDNTWELSFNLYFLHLHFALHFRTFLLTLYKQPNQLYYRLHRFFNEATTLLRYIYI